MSHSKFINFDQIQNKRKILIFIWKSWDLKLKYSFWLQKMINYSDKTNFQFPFSVVMIDVYAVRVEFFVTN